jgi:DNA-binding winged helix-turn-helix (wHTH) protein/tetratricopeptide (TPR) repeat protein
MEDGEPARSTATRLTFGPFTIDIDRGEVTGDRGPVHLRPKTFSLLRYLVDRAGRVVSKQELLQSLWPGVVVTDDSLTQAVRELRLALDDRERVLLRTVLRRGYRLDADVHAAPRPAGPSRASARAAGDERDEQYLVNGTVRRDGEWLHIVLDLAGADTGQVVRAERYDYLSTADSLTRRDLAARVANVLQTRVGTAGTATARAAHRGSGGVDRWMRGSYLLTPATRFADLMHVRTEFESALQAQPESTSALAGLARTYVAEVAHRWAADRKGSCAIAQALARQALEIDPRNQDAQNSLGAALIFDGSVDEAMTVVRRQLASHPNDGHANRDLASALYFTGRWKEALEQADATLELSALEPANVSHCHAIAATCLLVLGRYDDATRRARLIGKALRDKGGWTTILASAAALRGNLADARRHGLAQMRARPDFTIARYRASRGSVVAAYQAGIEKIDDGLRRAGLPEGAALT